jgi:hypothetical protein
MGLAMISCAKREEERWKTLDSYAKTFGQSIGYSVCVKATHLARERVMAA